MRSTRQLRTALGAAVVGSVLAAVVPMGAPAMAASPTLQVTQKNYVPGQRITYVGNLGVSGVRKIHLQFHMGNVDHDWNDVPGSGGRTSANGSFSLDFPAPAMRNIRYRVVGGRAATPPVTLVPKSQDLTLDATPGPGADQVTVHVDTAPFVSHRPDLPGPVIGGRALTLQERVAGGRWQTVGTTTTNSLGLGSFVQPVTPGLVTYRVREEDWTADGNKIGWYPSFPLTLDGTDAVTGWPGNARTGASSYASLTSQEPSALVRSTAGTTASKKHLWGKAQYDFAWEYGESLSSKPMRGLKRVGSVQDTSDGSGRVSPINGQLVLDSQRNWIGLGDFGTTTSTVTGNAMTYGRWETKVRFKRFETSAADFGAKIELVPAAVADSACGNRGITVAKIPVGGGTVDIGAWNPKGAEWTASKSIRLADLAGNFAVEVAKDHITWFFNGQTIGTVKNRAAVPGVPLTLRLTLGDDSGREMNHTQLLSDWQRAFTLERGAQVRNGAALRSGSYSPSPC